MYLIVCCYKELLLMFYFEGEIVGYRNCGH